MTAPAKNNTSLPFSFIMKLPTYDATCHPNEYIKQMRACCKLNHITNEQEVLEFCKLMIDSTITIPNKNEINSFDALVTALKLHSTFNIFKNTCKAKLRFLKYVSEKGDGDTSIFLSNFRSLCNNAEIINPEEIKNLLFKSFPPSNEFYRIEFTKRVNGINSVDEVLKIFSDVVMDELNVIKYDSLVTLKHVATGKYLSGGNKKKYQTGSKRLLVSSDDKLPNPNTLWIIKSSGQSFGKKTCLYNTVFYDEGLFLYHNQTCNTYNIRDYRLCIDNKHKSPTTGHVEVSIAYDKDYSVRCIKSNPAHDNDTPYVKTKDIVNLKCYPPRYGRSYFLRSHDFTFTIDNETFQEVVGHNERIGGNDEWCIELVENKF